MGSVSLTGLHIDFDFPRSCEMLHHLRISCVNCSGDSSGVEIGVGRAGDRAGETGRAGGGGGDERADGCGGRGEFKRAGDSDGGGGGGGVERTGCPAHA